MFSGQQAAPVQPVIIRETPRTTTGTPGPGTRFQSAAMVALSVGLAGGVVAGVFANAQWHDVATVAQWSAVCSILAGTVTLAAWTVFVMIDWHLSLDTLLWLAEQAINIDINQDGQIGEPTPQPPARVVVELQDKNANGYDRARYLEFGVPIDKLATFARSVLAGRQLSESVWTGRGGLFSKSEFARMRGQMLEAGVLRWIHPGAPAQGIEVTAAGRQVLRQIANSPTPPPE
jgi:hypothetical protein